MEASLHLDVSIVSAAPERLTFRYRARNAWNRDLYLFNRLFLEEPSGARRMDPARVHVLVEAAVLNVSKQLFTVPEGLSVEMPEVPYLTRLAPGATFEEEIALALPARESYPYLSPDGMASKGEKRVCEQFVFTLGYFYPKESRWIRTIRVDGEEVLATDYGFAIQTRESVSAAPLRVRTECIVLADPRRRRTRG